MIKKSTSKEKIKVIFFLTSCGAEDGAIGVCCAFIKGENVSRHGAVAARFENLRQLPTDSCTLLAKILL